jgi:hypothetical protein
MSLTQKFFSYHDIDDAGNPKFSLQGLAENMHLKSPLGNEITIHVPEIFNQIGITNGHNPELAK